MAQSRTHHDAMGLTAVSTEQLEILLRGVYRKTLPCPLTIAALAGHGLQDVAGPVLNHLRELDERSVRAVVVAVLAERRDDRG